MRRQLHTHPYAQTSRKSYIERIHVIVPIDDREPAVIIHLNSKEVCGTNDQKPKPDDDDPGLEREERWSELRKLITEQSTAIRHREILITLRLDANTSIEYRVRLYTPPLIGMFRIQIGGDCNVSMVQGPPMNGDRDPGRPDHAYICLIYIHLAR